MKKIFRVNVEDVDEVIEADNLDEAIDIVIKSISVHEEKDYCSNCEEFIEQIELEDQDGSLSGSFGCPKCKRDDCITYELVD
jgi:hypothetical protein